MKKLISILLVLTVLVNVIGFGFLNVKASAVAPVIEAIIQAITYTAKGALVGSAASVGAQTVQGITEAQQAKILQDSQSLISDISDGNLVSVNYNEDNNQFYFSVSPNVSSESAEFAQRLVNKLSEYDFHYVDTGMGAEANSRIPAYFYERIKTDVTNEYYNYIAQTAFTDALSTEAWNSSYNFDWTTGGIPSINLPTATEYVERIYDDFSISTGIRLNSNGLFASRPSYILGFNLNLSGNETNGYAYTLNGLQAYGFGSYIVYNGDIFYRTGLHNEKPYNVTIGGQFGNASMYRFVNSSGQNLEEAGCTDIGGLVGGFYICKKPKSESPDTPIAISASNLTEQTGGGELSLPLRDDEDIIAKYIETIGDPSTTILDIAPDGSITGADGITIEQIQALLEDLANQLNTDIDLSSLEAYLQAIEKACRNTLTGEQLNQALKGIKSKIKDYSGDLSKILSAINGVKALDQTQADKLTSIEEQTRAIAEALTAEQTITAEKTFDIDTPSVITDKFPFSLPFDVYNVYNLLSAEPEAPKFTIPIKMDGVFDYTFEVDLSEYEWIAVIVRWLLFIIFIVGLIIVTNKLIGRG